MILALMLACSSTKEESAIDAGVVPDDKDIKVNIDIADVKAPRKPRQAKTPKDAKTAKEVTETEKVEEATSTEEAAKNKTTDSESSTPN